MFLGLLWLLKESDGRELPFYFILNPFSSVCRNWIPRAKQDMCTKKILPLLPISVWLWVHNVSCREFHRSQWRDLQSFQQPFSRLEISTKLGQFYRFYFYVLNWTLSKYIFIWRLKNMQKTALPKEILLLSLESVWICELSKSGKPWFLFLILSLTGLSNHLHLQNSSETSSCFIVFKIGGAIWNGRHSMKDAAYTCGKEWSLFLKSLYSKWTRDDGEQMEWRSSQVKSWFLLYRGNTSILCYLQKSIDWNQNIYKKHSTLCTNKWDNGVLPNEWGCFSCCCYLIMGPWVSSATALLFNSMIRMRIIALCAKFSDPGPELCSFRPQ